MDADIGNILYIVLTLVVVIIGVLGKKKKPGTKSPGNQSATSRPSFMENLERVLSEGQKEPGIMTLDPDEEDLAVEVPSEKVVAEVPSAQEDGPMSMSEYNRIMNRDTDGDPNLIQSEGESMTEPIEIIDLDTETDNDFLEMIQNFDGKTAIVYSSIINRLDY
jgi:hypothetical protein